MRRKRVTVLHFTSACAYGGAEAHLAALARALDRSEFEPLIACPAALAGMLDADVEIVPLDLSRARDFRALPQLVRLFRRREVDILHSHLFASSAVASPAARLAGVGAVVETPHVCERWRRGPWKSRYVADRLLARAVDAFIAVSEANARYLVDEKRLPAHKVRVIPNGVEIERFGDAAISAERLRERLGFAPSDRVLAVIGRLEPQKGHRVLLDALGRVRPTAKSVRLVVVGEGSLRATLEAETEARGLGGAVRFVGQQSNVADWLALAEIVVLPSFYEGLPLVALEALAAERPLVASAVDGVPEVVHDGRTGLTAPPGDAARLAEAILRLLNDPAHGCRLARAGRELVAERFTHRQQVRETEALYRELLEHRHAVRRASGALAAPAQRFRGAELR